MCGFAGYLELNNSNAIAVEHLEKMQKVIAHRGPDDYGIWKSDEHGVGLCHRRLSIIDLSAAGHQPMSDKQNSVVIVFNGEIYNHQAIRTQLESLGHTYFSQTDTETLIYAYKQWGINFISKLEGMFSFVLLDKTKNEIYMVRDRIGIKPLYFGLQGNKLCFGSEIKSFWQLPWMKKKTNPQALYHYLTYMVTPAPMTLYQDVYKLPAGHYMKIDAQRTMTFHEWYNPADTYNDVDPRQYNDEKWVVNLIREQLRKSIEKRMMSDVPVGVFLSGGIDSSLNVALMSEISDKVETFNVVAADDPENDERSWAKKVSKHFGTKHHEIIIDEKDAFNFFEKMVHHQDEPIADCVCVPLYHVSKLARDSGVTVVQVGEGSDELFSGYSLYARYQDVYKKYWQPSQKFIPGFARKIMYKTAKSLFSARPYHLDAVNNWANGKHFFWSGAVAFPEVMKRMMFTHPDVQVSDPLVEKIYPGLRQGYDSYDFVEYHLKNFKQKRPDATFLDRMIYLELKNRLPELLLMRVDKMAMATSIEGRVPFLDHTFVEHALRVPAHLKYKNGQTKYILKKACEGILPHDVIYRKKIGFAAPTSNWYRNGKYFKQYFNDTLTDNAKVIDRWVDVNQIRTMFNQHVAGQRESSVQLWVIQNVLKSLADAEAQ